jgi:serine-type D-Ala-D-Ala carboxypeptidase (penicillin-binding protein 5/6)
MRRMAKRHLTIGLATLLVASAAAAGDARELGRVTAKAAIVVDSRSGEVEFARNPTLPLPPASTTKLLTALISLRQLSPDAALPVSVYASTMPPTRAGLKPGWQVNARDLLYALMLHSSNDASVVLAEGIGGSVPGFARIMNATARSLGATDSNFVTPNGLPAANHYTTARDMALIMRQVLQTPGMVDILSTRTAVIEPLSGSRKRIPLKSTNRLLWRDDLHVIGKTGWTRQAKRCFVGAANAPDGREVIVAVLGSSDLWSDVEALVTYGLQQSGPGGDGLERAGEKPGLLAAAPLGTVWSRPGNERDELAVVAAPARDVDERRSMRMAALTAPTTSGYGRKNKAAAAAARGQQQAQGDGIDARRARLRYALHIGSFRSKVRADELRKNVSKTGYEAEVEPVGGAYRVTVPNFQTRDDARKAAQTLSRKLRVDPVIVAGLK